MTISAGALFGSSLIAAGSAAMNKWIEKRRYERQLADQHKLWQENNAYNSPAAQMARLKSAGLNPNLVYQNGGVSAPSDQISPPSFQSSPINEFNSVIPNSIQATSIEADIDNKNAVTASLLADNRVKDTPLGQLEEFNQLTDSTKKEMSNLFGVEFSQLPSLNMRFLANRQNYENIARDSAQMRQMLDILKQEKNIAVQEAIRAEYQQIVDYMAMHSEAKTRGYQLSDVNVRGAYSFKGLDKKNFDYAAGIVVNTYNEGLANISNANWENTGFRRGVRTFSDILGGVGSVLPGFGSLLKKGTPTIRGIEREGYDKKRGRYIETINYNY